MDKNRPRSRERHVTSGGSGVHRRGSGLGGGPVGSGKGPGAAGSGPSGGFRPSGSGGQRPGGPGGRRPGGCAPFLGIIILAIVLLGGGGGFLGGLMGDSDSGGSSQSYYELINGGSSGFSGSGSGSSSSASGWADGGSNTGVLNREVSSKARKKYTTIKGDGTDVVTLMVYMCGTDLESRSGMATNDLSEMAKSSLGKNKNVNLIVYTGGCKGWRNNIVSSKYNQIYQVADGGLRCLEKNMGKGAMTDPATLTDFILYCKKKFPANRNELIFWDHGGGSLSGYGYDEKNPRYGSMTLDGINTALKKADMKFDFIGFDTCLMATVENALMLSRYADYMIASEETEPGVGWYYTNWLTRLSDDSSRDTLDIAKDIIDDFVKVCDRQCRGQKTTLSVVDLSELQETVPGSFTAFSKDTRTKIQDNDYKMVSTARGNTREFSPASRIDQIDLVHFAKNMGTSEGADLSRVLLDAIKYNRTSSNMTNAYGISAYFPYKRSSNVDKAVETYSAIGMDEEYANCIREFASMETAGQIATGGTSSPLSSLFGDLDSGSSVQNESDINQLLNAFLGSYSGINGLSSGNTSFFKDSSLNTEDMAAYIADHQLDTANLFWKKNKKGQPVISMDEDQWDMVTMLDYGLFYDDGEGYVELGYDNVFDFDDDGNLIGNADKTWVSIDGQVVAYYHTDTTEDGDDYTITGRVPARLNGQRVDLILVFDQDRPKGYVAGARPVYDETETETESRGLIDLKKGDKIDFLCDFYGYDKSFKENYMLGKQFTVPGTMEELTISNTNVGNGKVLAMYRFTDIYQQNYWTQEIPQ